MLKTTLSVLLVLGGYLTMAQPMLSLSDAIGMALEQNPNVKVAYNQATQAENQATLGQAGLLPTVSANGSYNTGENDSRVEVANQPEPIIANGAGATNISASVNVEYTLFAGFVGQNNLKRLRVQADLSESATRLEVENMVLQVASAYYNVARSYRNQQALSESLRASEDRWKRSKAKQELSGGTRLNALNAEVDYNKDKVAYLDAQRAYQDALDQLYLLINKGEPTQLQPDTQEIAIAGVPQLTVLQEQLLAQNAQMLQARYAEQASLLDYKISKSAYYPQLKLTGSYAYNRNEQEGSFLLSNQTTGYTTGITLAIPLYQGGKRNIQTQNARLEYQNAQLSAQQTEWRLYTDLKAAYREYTNSLEILEIEESNLETAQLNFDYSQQQFEQGQLTGLQFREAQVNLLLAANNYNNVQYNASLAALELLRLTGGLMGEMASEE